MPRLMLLASCALVVLGAALPAGAAARAPRPACAASHSRTVHSSSVARVYTVSGRTLYGCWKATGRRVQLAEKTSELDAGTSFADVRLAGRYVAWYDTSFDLTCAKYMMCPPGYDSTPGTVQVFDLRRRRTLRATAAKVAGSDLVLTQRGGAAWIQSAQLRALDGGGARTLDPGPVTPGSVRAEISIVSWLSGGAEHFSRLR